MSLGNMGFLRSSKPLPRKIRRWVGGTDGQIDRCQQDEINPFSFPFEKITNELQSEILCVRIRSFVNIWSRFPDETERRGID
jgi:hypothetical protein